ncbi:hypothetical protein Kirov_233 [Bacillus phage Kirov]|uniref:Uncharacterized protein n=1 Tax=Bacillus phage Kirov TaxID=2783539 RepID=A0A7U3NKP4_9CAUD|nr:hypothetical protein PQE67_gp071 [Bacillus phage Kirov]QOV08432.1 hypothetical protein Kirov_233 [Bacillus phage Kirov]
MIESIMQTVFEIFIYGLCVTVIGAMIYAIVTACPED